MKTNGNKIEIDSTLCSTCLSCVQVCPNKIFILQNKKLELRENRIKLCLQCGQCMAACENKAVKISGLNYNTDFIEYKDIVNADFFEQLIQTRRSVRHFKKEEVPAGLLVRIVESVGFAPVSFPPHKTEISIFQNKQLLLNVSKEINAFYEKMIVWFRSPFMRFMIKRNSGNKQFKILQNHVMPLLRTKMPEIKSENEDAILRNAPVLILFHAQKDKEIIETDIHIALTYCMLAAHNLGLGTCVIDLVAPAVNKSPNLKNLMQIPQENEIFSALILGFPKVKYFRTIKRKVYVRN